MRAKVPRLAEDLRRLAYTLDDRAYRYQSSDQLCSKLRDEAPDILASLQEGRNDAQSVYVSLSTIRATAVLLQDGLAFVQLLRESITAIAQAYEFAEHNNQGRELGDLKFPAEQYSGQLEGLAPAVSQLTTTHLTVHEHAAAFGSEYWVRQTVRTMTDESEQYELLNEAFYAPLLDARDAFFLDGSSTKLERYVVVAEELTATEHPLAAALKQVPYIVKHPTRGTAAADLLDVLETELLMTPLLVEDR